MALPLEIKRLIEKIKDLVESSQLQNEDIKFWNDAGSQLLVFIDQIVTKSTSINALTPKDYSSENQCILETIFIILDQLKNVNRPFDNDIWDSHYTRSTSNLPVTSDYSVNMISFYELALSRCCAYITQLLGDKFTYVQKLLIKYLFGSSNVCSLFASDIYVFILRIIHPHQKMAMCLIIMNMCKSAPREALVKGAALINRVRHPIVNFENPKYQYLLDFS